MRLPENGNGPRRKISEGRVILVAGARYDLVETLKADLAWAA